MQICYLCHPKNTISDMKRTLCLSLIVISILSIGCSKKLSTFTTHNMNGECGFIVKTDPKMFDEDQGVGNSYTLVWPDKGMISKEAERELIIQTFGDSTATTADEAAKRFLKNLWLDYDGIKAVHTQILDSIPYGPFCTYCNVSNKVSQDSNLVTFTTFTDFYYAGAAHGTYTVEYLTYDRQKKQVLHLHDLVDTTRLGEVVLRAIEDLTVNKDVCDCVFDEYKTGQPIIVPDNFFIDSTRSTINIVFQQYDITPYACGLQTVVMPIFWLSKHRNLTPYAKELFGKGSYLE